MKDVAVMDLSGKAFLELIEAVKTGKEARNWALAFDDSDILEQALESIDDYLRFVAANKILSSQENIATLLGKLVIKRFALEHCIETKNKNGFVKTGEEIVITKDDVPSVETKTKDEKVVSVARIAHTGNKDVDEVEVGTDGESDAAATETLAAESASE